ncbi:tetratricopeptide repeat protein 39B isoform X1 [Selaginella moellendorffii]|uniref:tetratricopeptide repeat protein 39B isoform X1 n=1 Tax=Selaginella moellendorffii TaxID=88036 RepID=UPI000D1C6F63|nr:tetratricopeptide repeat protein 39B isoform X1 [Selaginella moellendorffii]|eukprot:XP_024541753.1 tetratricopeptide repeat protein 39B isoform X1 [Selaginella moellendorffii]
MAAAAECYDVTRDCDEAEQALRLLLQGKFDEAEDMIVARVNARDSVAGAVPIFTHCHAVILFAKAGISGAEEDRKQAMEKLGTAASMAENLIPKQGWVQSIATWGMGYFSSPSPKSDDISEEELSCRIIEAEATFLSALLCFFEESIAAFFRAALLIRKAIRGYKHCHAIIKKQEYSNRSEHNVSAVKLGFGGFSLAISMLPPKMLRLLSVLGFPSDRAAGLNSINESLKGGGLRAPLSGVLLLSYHVILPAFFSTPQEREDHVASAVEILNFMEETYPKSFFLSFYEGRLKRLNGDLQGSMECFQSLERGLKLSSTSHFFKLRHAWVYELGLGHMLLLQWEEAEKYWIELKQDSAWSRAFFAYLHGVCLSMRGEAKLAAKEFAEVQGLLRGTMSGRVLAEEQYASRKVKDHALDTMEGAQGVQGQLCGVEFLYLWNSFPQMPKEELEAVVHIIDKAEKSLRSSHRESAINLEKEDEEEPDDYVAICNLIKGTALREQRKLVEAHSCLDLVREDDMYVESELFVIPMAAYERALLLMYEYNDDQSHPLKLISNAKKELDTAEGFKRDYNFLWRLLGRVHAARGALKSIIGEEQGSTNSDTSTITDNDDEKWEDCIDEVDETFFMSL